MNTLILVTFATRLRSGFMIGVPREVWEMRTDAKLITFFLSFSRIPCKKSLWENEGQCSGYPICLQRLGGQKKVLQSSKRCCGSPSCVQNEKTTKHLWRNEIWVTKKERNSSSDLFVWHLWQPGKATLLHFFIISVIAIDMKRCCIVKSKMAEKECQQTLKTNWIFK